MSSQGPAKTPVSSTKTNTHSHLSLVTSTVVFLEEYASSSLSAKQFGRIYPTEALRVDQHVPSLQSRVCSVIGTRANYSQQESKSQALFDDYSMTHFLLQIIQEKEDVRLTGSPAIFGPQKDFWMSRSKGASGDKNDSIKEKETCSFVPGDQFQLKSTLHFYFIAVSQ